MLFRVTGLRIDLCFHTFPLFFNIFSNFPLQLIFLFSNHIFLIFLQMSFFINLSSAFLITLFLSQWRSYVIIVRLLSTPFLVPVSQSFYLRKPSYASLTSTYSYKTDFSFVKRLAVDFNMEEGYRKAWNEPMFKSYDIAWPDST